MTAARKRPAAGMGAGPAPALKRGPWSPDEDELLKRFVAREGEGRWRVLPRRAGLQRCGKSCRLRWMNYLRPDIKRGPIAGDEEDLILRLHRLLGNRWSLIAGRLPGRSDNEIKNYWNSHLSKKLIAQGIDPRTHKPLKTAPRHCSSNRNSTKPPPISSSMVEPPSSSRPSPPPPLLAQPGASSLGGGGTADIVAAATTGGVAGLDSDDGFEGFFGDDEFIRAWDNSNNNAPRGVGGGFDWDQDPVVDDDGTFSSFLNSLINEDHQFAHYFGDHKDDDADDKDQQGGAS